MTRVRLRMVNLLLSSSVLLNRSDNTLARSGVDVSHKERSQWLLYAVIWPWQAETLRVDHRDM